MRYHATTVSGASLAMISASVVLASATASPGGIDIALAISSMPLA